MEAAKKSLWGAMLLSLTHLPTRLSQPRRALPPVPARMLLQSDPAASTPPPPRELAAHPRRMSEEELRADAERRMPSLPLAYWHRNQGNKNKFYNTKDCAPLPSVYDIQFDNVYWQTLHTAAKGTFYLYGAYLDTRNASPIGPAVRILVMHDRVKPTLATHCQLWFEDRDDPVIVRNLEYKCMWQSDLGNYKDNVLLPYLLTCVLPKEVRNLVPASVSLVEAPCDRAVTNLRVYYSRPPTPTDRKDFAVCVKGLDFQHEDFSVRLIEWIELLALLGAEKLYFYELHVHPNMTKIIEHYRSRGLVEVTQITLPGGRPNLPSLQHLYLTKKWTHQWQNELIPYNDCFYRHMYEYRYIVVIDVDEVIVPLIDGDWKGLMKRVLPKSLQGFGKPPRSSYYVRFMDPLKHAHGWLAEVPHYMHMLQHVYRMRNFAKPEYPGKAFNDAERVLLLHNHDSLACLGGECSSYAIDRADAQLQHYRDDGVTGLNISSAAMRQDYMLDDTVWRWKDALIGRADAALRHLGFLQNARSPRRYT